MEFAKTRRVKHRKENREECVRQLAIRFDVKCLQPRRIDRQGESEDDIGITLSREYDSVSI